MHTAILLSYIFLHFFFLRFSVLFFFIYLRFSVLQSVSGLFCSIHLSISTPFTILFRSYYSTFYLALLQFLDFNNFRWILELVCQIPPKIILWFRLAFLREFWRHLNTSSSVLPFLTFWLVSLKLGLCTAFPRVSCTWAGFRARERKNKMEWQVW